MMSPSAKSTGDGRNVFQKTCCKLRRLMLSYKDDAKEYVCTVSRILKIFLENDAAIRRHIRRFCSNASDIDDFMQEAFLQSFAAELRTDIRNPKAFVFEVAKNVALADYRKSKRSPTDRLEDFGGADLILDESQSSATDDLDGRRKLAVFARAVAHLPPKCREAFLMRRIDGLPYKQIANRMNISVSAVEKHVATGLLKCHSFLLEYGFEPSEFGGARKEKASLAGNVFHGVVRKDD